MEYIEGESLAAYVSKHGALSEEQTRALMWPILDAMSHLHRQRICHLDIKPGNIMLGREENGDIRPVLIDFGLSKHYDNTGRPTTTVNTLGVSEGYSPREQYSGISSFSPQSDIYALGATLYYCLTGQTPRSSLLVRDGELAAELPADVSPEMRDLVEKMTREVHTRPASLEELNGSVPFVEHGEGDNDASAESLETRLISAVNRKGGRKGKSKQNSSRDDAGATEVISRSESDKSKKRWITYALIALAAVVISGLVMLILNKCSGGKADVVAPAADTASVVSAATPDTAEAAAEEPADTVKPASRPVEAVEVAEPKPQKEQTAARKQRATFVEIFAGKVAQKRKFFVTLCD